MVTSPRVVAGPYVVGEVPAPLVYSFEDDDGSALNLTGYAATFTWRRVDVTTTTAAVTGAGTLTNAVAGEVTFTWPTDPFAEPGRYVAEFWVANGANRFASVLIAFTVRAQVASTAVFGP